MRSVCLFALLVFGHLGAAFAEDLRLQVGIKTIRISQDTEKARLSISHNLNLTYHLWWLQRDGRRESENPEGSRDYWSRPLSSSEFSRVFDSPYTSVLDKQKLQSTETDLVIELLATSTQGWHKLFFLDKDTAGAIASRLHNFANIHRDVLENLSEQQLDSFEALTGANCRQDVYFCYDPNTRMISKVKLSERQDLERMDALAVYCILDSSACKNFSFFELREDSSFKALMSGAPERRYILKKSFNVALESPTLIVVHASTDFDPKQTAKAGIDEMVERFKKAEGSVAYLMADDSYQDASWYLSDRNPTVARLSAGGEHNLNLSTNDVTVAGGFLGRCHQSALKDSIGRYFYRNQGELTLRVPLRAVYAPIISPDRSADDGQVLSELLSKKSYQEQEDFLVAELLPGLEALGEDLMGREMFSSMDPTHIKIRAKDYTLRLYISNRLVREVGQGPRKVNIVVE